MYSTVVAQGQIMWRLKNRLIAAGPKRSCFMRSKTMKDSTNNGQTLRIDSVIGRVFIHQDEAEYSK